MICIFVITVILHQKPEPEPETSYYVYSELVHIICQRLSS